MIVKGQGQGIAYERHSSLSLYTCAIKCMYSFGARTPRKVVIMTTSINNVRYVRCIRIPSLNIGPMWQGIVRSSSGVMQIVRKNAEVKGCKETGWYMEMKPIEFNKAVSLLIECQWEDERRGSFPFNVEERRLSAVGWLKNMGY